MMHLNEYQSKAIETAIYPDQGDNIVYPALGLAGEAGEVAEKVKKIIRDDGGHLTEVKREQLIGELGDIMWYIAAMCDELGTDMAVVAQMNIDKLHSRKERGTLKGSGDDR